MPVLSIRRTLPILIVTPILVTIVLSGFLSYVNSRKAVETLALKISQGTTDSIKEYLRAVMDKPQSALKASTAALNPDQFQTPDAIIQRLWDVTNQPNLVDNLYVGQSNGHFLGIFPWSDGSPSLEIRSEETAPQLTVYRLNGAGEPTDLLETRIYDPRERPWYQAALALEPGQTGWSEVYPYAATAELGITAIAPLYDQNRSLYAVFAIDVSLSDIQGFLQTLDISPAGEAFVMDRDGQIIATSTEQSTALETGDDPERVLALELDNPNHANLMSQLQAHLEGDWSNAETAEYFPLMVDGVKQFVGIVPFQDEQGLDWLMVVAIPETDFQDIILANTRSTVLIGSIIAVFAIALGLVVARWLVVPIERLNNAALSIENNTFQSFTLDAIAKRQDELGTLSQVFQRMGQVIMSSQASLREQMDELEAEMAKAKRHDSLKPGALNLGTVEGLLARSRQHRATIRQNQDIDLPSLLKTVPYFHYVGRAEIETLIAMGDRQTLPAKTIIFREDEPGDSFFVILSGAVEIYVEALDKFLTTLSPGSFFGELSLLLGIPRTATVRTTQETTLFCLSQAGLRYLLQQHPDIGEQIAQALHTHKAELESRQDLLMTDANDAANFTANPLTWIRGRMNRIFGSSSTQPSS
ncbi:cyclic nucleotide-binding domain-containing protein [Spirulina major CS-329]|uniref:cyclic nucleotide-binding domain-containing protein n=1 Tax=Spirulina TaxID=1154 RepID=UPI00232C410B|nr:MULTISPECIES: cyclic nucleotide-binding domain-containing protein [Spirulina]MDB9494076.1 cyclic nucleotide-binding domain-containing protein [Spirulina subsalsa CS-330]MDB9504898.1 cyclic nucleotide-binding domain-containing protein [Spirulina major CS-329]